jgi:hypothetical protein
MNGGIIDTIGGGVKAAELRILDFGLHIEKNYAAAGSET